MKTKRQAGFTLVELLISFVMVVAMLGLITELFRNSRQTYDKQEEIADRQQAQLISISQLSYELGLAGYRGTDGDDVKTRTFSGPTHEIVDGTSDSITVRYYEDNWTETGQPVLKEVKFSIADETLLRTDLSDPTNAIELIDGISALNVTGYVDKEERRTFPTPLSLETTLGLVIKLTFKDGTTQTMSVGFSNTQQDGSTLSASTDAAN